MTRKESNFRAVHQGMSAERRWTEIFEKAKNGSGVEDKIMAQLADFCLTHEIGASSISRQVGISETQVLQALRRYMTGTNNMSLRMATIFAEFADKRLVLQ